MIHRNIFNLVSGPDWQLRRNSFKHSFSLTGLRIFQDKMIMLTQRMSQKIEDLAQNSSNLIELDMIFGQMTIDVICMMAFGIDFKAMDNSAIFQVIEEPTLDFHFFLFAIL